MCFLSVPHACDPSGSLSTELSDLRHHGNLCLVWFLLIYADVSAAFGVSQGVAYTHMHVNTWERHQSLVWNMAVRTWNNGNFSFSVVKPLKISRTAAVLQINCLFGLVCSFHTFILSVSPGVAPGSVPLTPSLQNLLTLHPCSTARRAWAVNIPLLFTASWFLHFLPADHQCSIINSATIP